jgi:hypothetical protein
MRAFFWETTPFSVATAGEIPFEFVALPAPSLEATQPDCSAFAEHPTPPPPPAAPNSVGQFRVFENLGRDAVLIAPPAMGATNRTLPRGALAHLAAFIRDAPPTMKLELFAALGHALALRFSPGARSEWGRGLVRGGGGAHELDAPIWVNTEGSGVPCLHVRLDSRSST